MSRDKTFRPDTAAMPSKREGESPISETDATDLNLPFSLYRSFASVAGIPIKLCGMDGEFLAGVPSLPLAGPCKILSKGNAFGQTCSDNHAAAAATAVELCRPYIFTCHMRLASWAVPVLQNNEPLPAVIICGGALLSEPDIALTRHLEETAREHEVDPEALVQSLDSVPVLSREQMRGIADFLFQMSASFVSYASLPGASEVPTPPAAPAVTPTPIVFPPARLKETRKAKLERARILERQHVEIEIIRLLRERKPETAQEILVGLLKADTENASAEGSAANLNMVETFARLFRSLGKGARIVRSLQQKQSRFITEVLTQKHSTHPTDVVERACGKFMLIAEELIGEPRPRKVKAIQKFLENNLSSKLTLGVVGKKFGLKEKTLDALVRKHFGMGFTDYVASLRVSEAKRLLLTTELTMGDIARRTGFRDQSYFTKVFKSRIGSTPTEFKSKKRK